MLKQVIVAMLIGQVSSAVIRTAFFPEEVIQNDLTCWTCPEKDNNTECNNWAPDVPCHLNHSVCQTIHVLNMTTRETLYVQKQCTTMDQCLPEHIGCQRNTTTQIMECISCCTASYCNQAIPFNTTEAIALSSMDFLHSSASRQVPWFVSLLTVVIALVSKV